MTLLNYTDPIPLPAPLASGAAFASYTDPTGEVWVAKGGVNNGLWKKARDVLHCRISRDAAYNWTATLTVLNYDGSTTKNDNYGLYVGNYITTPVAGWWKVHGRAGCTPSTAGIFSLYLQNAGGGVAEAQGLFGNSTVGPIHPTADLTAYMAVGAQWGVAIVGPATIAGSAGQAHAVITADYLGTG